MPLLQSSQVGSTRESRRQVFSLLPYKDGKQTRSRTNSTKTSVYKTLRRRIYSINSKWVSKLPLAAGLIYPSVNTRTSPVITDHVKATINGNG